MVPVGLERRLSWVIFLVCVLGLGGLASAQDAAPADSKSDTAKSDQAKPDTASASSQSKSDTADKDSDKDDDKNAATASKTAPDVDPLKRPISDKQKKQNSKALKVELSKTYRKWLDEDVRWII